MNIKENLSQVQSRESSLNERLIDFRTKYAKIIELRNLLYQEDLNKNPDLKGVFNVLANHNKIVEEYVCELTNALESEGGLKHEESVAAKIAAILHDSAKLDSSLLNHHVKSGERSDKILLENFIDKFQDGFEGEVIDGLEINHATILKIRRAIQRHMNHPFLVSLNKGEFSKPVNNIDKIVFDVDMLANIGFKNVGFRIKNPKFIEEDREMADKKRVPLIKATFENVLNSACSLGGNKEKRVMTTDLGQKKAEKLIANIINIYNNIDFNRLQEELDNDNNKAVEIINNHIVNASKKFKISSDIYDKFLI